MTKTRSMRSAALLLCLILALSMLFACAPAVTDQNGGAEATPAPTAADSPETRSTTATAAGFGGTVTVTVTLSGGAIAEVVAEGPSETEGIGSLAIEKLPPKMVEQNSVEVDALSGATITSKAVLAAAREAYSAATGTAQAEAPVKMEPGTYVGTGMGFSRTAPVPVTVTVSETKILSIELGYYTDEKGAGYYDGNEETVPILRSAETFLVPRILEHQSVAVDSVSGATASSSAIKQAVADALTQALEKGGSSPSALSAFETVPAKLTGVTEQLNCSVLVVGMGGTGCAAAMSAAETLAEANRPVSVLAIDKAGKYGGTSAVTSSPMAINPPRFMEANDYQIRPYQLGPANAGKVVDLRPEGAKYYIDEDAMRSAWLAYTDGDAKEEMVDLFFAHSGETLDWLMYDHGFFFGLPQRGLGPQDYYYCVYNYDDSFMTNKHIIATYFDSIMADFTALGGEYMLETEAYELIYDESSNRVTGVKARGQDGTEYEIHADAVVLGTGGFAGSGEMETKYLSNEYYPLSGAWNTYAMTQNDGKMIQSAIDIGAGTYNIGMPPMTHIGGSSVVIGKYEVQTSADGTTWCLNDVPMHMAVNPNVLAVNRFGERFAAETGLTFLESWKAGPYFFSIWSAEQIDEVKANGFKYNSSGPGLGYGGMPVGMPVADIYEVLDYCVELGFVYKADTVEALANAIGANAQTLAQTVEAYNGYCASGTDEQFGKGAEYLDAIGSGPYYAVTGSSYCYSTCGGLDVNTDLNVLKADGQTPINGLYAAGTDCMGVLFSEKKEYVTYGGAAQGWAFTSGKLAGRSAARSAQGE